MRAARTTLLLALATAAPAALAFEGAMDVKMAHTRTKGDDAEGPAKAENGTGKIYLAKQGVRMEWSMGEGQRHMQMATLMLRSQPNKIFFVNDAAKTYHEMDTSKHHRKDDEDKDEKITVKKLGNEKVAGYDCAHGIVSTDKGEQVEVWSSKDVGDLSEFMSGWGSSAQDASWKRKYEALKSAGLTGWPMKWVDRKADRDGSTSGEVTKVAKGAPPASLFDLSGYKKTEGFAGAVQLSPEQQKQMDDAMKKLTPEQRQQLDKMMKNMGK